MRSAFNAKTVYVVGGSSGIGLAAALRLAQAGARVALLARRSGPLAEAAAKVAAAVPQDARDDGDSGDAVTTRTLDVTDDAAVRETLGELGREFGPPDLMINCAGRSLPRRIEDLDAAAFEATLRANLVGTFSVASAVLPMMRERGRGHIVNVASVAGFVGVFGYTDYCASKFGVVGFSEALRQEVVRDGIEVSVLCPPDTDTPGFALENETKPKETHALSGNVKLMTPEAVADVLLRGIVKKRFLIIPGRDGRLTHLAKRWAPGLVDRFMLRTIKKVGK